MTSLGTIEEVDLREAWEHEATDFTNWLAEEENLSQLGNEIGIDLSLIGTEEDVGHFSADIFAKDAMDERKVIIENQLEPTDHDHLGKIITYASGLEAEIIIWIVQEGREEHQKAVDWLNNHTDEEFNFFLIEIELWQIEGSPMAPKFETVTKPNNWAKKVRWSAKEAELSETEVKQRKFWQKFTEFVEGNSASLSPSRKPRPRNYYDIHIGSSRVHISLTINTVKNFMQCKLYIREGESLLYELEDNKGQIESKIGKELNWEPAPDKKASYVSLIKEFDFEQTENWNEYFAWMLDTAEQFERVFDKYI